MKSKHSFTDHQFKQAVEASQSIIETLTYLNLRSSGSNYAMVQKKIKEMDLSTEHWRVSKSGPQGKRLSLDEILIKDSPYHYSRSLKTRLLRAGLLEYRCYICGINEWNNKELTLQMDHSNGDRYDNRIENLRLLCPNCHSQTPTHGGKNTKKNSSYKINKNLKRAIAANQKKKKYKKNNCIDCNKGITKAAVRCKSCQGKTREQTKINWPPADELFKKVKETSYTKVAKELGVSDNAVRKRIKNHT